MASPSLLKPCKIDADAIRFSIQRFTEMENIPQHVAIILDGNGRWAKSRGLSRLQGHREGAKHILQMVEIARNEGIRHLTLFCFSTENWNRPAAEVEGLMRLLPLFIRRYRRQILQNEIRIHWLGNPEGVPISVRKSLEKLVQNTRHCEKFHLNLAFNYGGRDELLRATAQLIQMANAQKIFPAAIANWKDFNAFLDSHELPDVDLLIRPGGEMRLSNFLPLQSVYAELYFTSLCWPEFDGEAFHEALEEFGRRQRRFGTIRENS